MAATEGPPERLWWHGGEERCDFCLQRYAYGLAVHCTHCDRPMCPVCAVVVTARVDRLCRDCHVSAEDGGSGDGGSGDGGTAEPGPSAGTAGREG